MTIERGGEDLARMRISVTTLGDMLLNSWDRDPAKLAISFPSGTRTYDELVANVLLRARGLWAQGVRPRQHVGILMPSGIEFLRSEEHTSELQSLMRISYAVFCLKKKT